QKRSKKNARVLPQPNYLWFREEEHHRDAHASLRADRNYSAASCSGRTEARIWRSYASRQLSLLSVTKSPLRTGYMISGLSTPGGTVPCFASARAAFRSRRRVAMIILSLGARCSNR